MPLEKGQEDDPQAQKGVLQVQSARERRRHAFPEEGRAISISGECILQSSQLLTHLQQSSAASGTRCPHCPSEVAHISEIHSEHGLWK